MFDWIRERRDPIKNFRRLIRLLGEANKGGNMHRAVRIRNKLLHNYGCCISPLAVISSSAEFPHPCGIVIGDGCVVGDDCTIYQNVTIGRKKTNIGGYPILSEGCTVYAGAVIAGSIILAPRTTVAANAVVTSGVDSSECLLAGVPAKVLRHSSTLQS